MANSGGWSSPGSWIFYLSSLSLLFSPCYFLGLPYVCLLTPPATLSLIVNVTPSLFFDYRSQSFSKSASVILKGSTWWDILQSATWCPAPALIPSVSASCSDNPTETKHPFGPMCFRHQFYFHFEAHHQSTLAQDTRLQKSSSFAVPDFCLIWISFSSSV